MLYKVFSSINPIEISCALIYTQTDTIDTQEFSEFSLILGMWNQFGDVQYQYVLKIKSKFY